MDDISTSTQILAEVTWRVLACRPSRATVLPMRLPMEMRTEGKCSSIGKKGNLTQMVVVHFGFSLVGSKFCFQVITRSGSVPSLHLPVRILTLSSSSRLNTMVKPEPRWMSSGFCLSFHRPRSHWRRYMGLIWGPILRTIRARDQVLRISSEKVIVGISQLALWFL